MCKIVPFLALVLMMPCIADAADKCVFYKKNPDVNLNVPDWSKSIVQPLDFMDLYHGNVVATLADNYDVAADINELADGGICVGLDSVNATIGYVNFLVKIDMRHRVDSCSYNAVLAHENEHIKAYLSVINDYYNDIKNAVYTAANSITPIYVETAQDVHAALDNLNEQLQSHPAMILIKQRIYAEEELRNLKIDENEFQYDELEKCND